MIFNPQKYNIADVAGEPFIDWQEIRHILACTPMQSVEQVIELSKQRQRLTLEQVATLINASSPEAKAKVLSAARELKEQIYGRRIVLFAPLYVGNHCTNRCAYCSFRADNGLTQRKTLSPDELTAEIEALEDAGHKRLILVFGEHPKYSAQFIADTVRQSYAVRKANGQIRRVNINAAPMSRQEFETIAEAGIGTYQIFQETYDPVTYAKYHLGGKKTDYNWRLTALDRAMQAGIDDVGIGALLGLGDWRADVLALVRHTNHLEACFSVGPHTISFPRITDALGGSGAGEPVSDEDFIYAIAVLRLAVPYAGLILTARESAELRTRAIEYGVSQIDGGTQIEIGSYAKASNEGTGQFSINDNRSLEDIIRELIEADYLPSFCTACYRKGRTGEHFMEFSTKGFIKRFCTPNALLTLAEYLQDYGRTSELYDKGWELIERNMQGVDNLALVERLRMIREQGARDVYF